MYLNLFHPETTVNTTIKFFFFFFLSHKIHKDKEKRKGNKPLTFSTMESRWVSGDCSRLEKGNTKSAVGKIEKKKKKKSTCFIPKKTRKV